MKIPPMAIMSLKWKRLLPMVLGCLLSMGMVTFSNAGEWQPLTGETSLRNFMSGLKAERTLPNGEVSRGEYNSDGTGTLFADADDGIEVPRGIAVDNDGTVTSG